MPLSKKEAKDLLEIFVGIFENPFKEKLKYRHQLKTIFHEKWPIHLVAVFNKVLELISCNMKRNPLSKRTNSYGFKTEQIELDKKDTTMFSKLTSITRQR